MNPVSDRCAAIHDRKHHTVIGVSPFNSYFSEERLKSLFTWAKTNFDSFHVFIPDEASRYTLEAIGYPTQKARRKARRQANYLINKVNRALNYVLGNVPSDLIVTNSVLQENQQYVAALNAVETLFHDNEEFRDQCLACTQWVMENQISDFDKTNEVALHLGVKYLLEEMPMFLNSPEILGEPSSVFSYHQCPDILKGLYKARTNPILNKDQGFIVMALS